MEKMTCLAGGLHCTECFLVLSIICFCWRLSLILDSGDCAYDLMKMRDSSCVLIMTECVGGKFHVITFSPIMNKVFA